MTTADTAPDVAQPEDIPESTDMDGLLELFRESTDEAQRLRGFMHALMAERVAVTGLTHGAVFKAAADAEPPGDLTISAEDGMLTARLALPHGTRIEPLIPPVAEGIPPGGRWLDIAFAGHNQHCGYVTEIEINGRTVFRIDLPDRLWGGDDSAWVEYGADFLFSRAPVTAGEVYVSWAAERARRERWRQQEAERECRLTAMAITAGDPGDEDDPYMRITDLLDPGQMSDEISRAAGVPVTIGFGDDSEAPA